ncbi:MAG: hypothetical protein WCH43_02645, partial [Verrucomicrobiota bacterium]
AGSQPRRGERSESNPVELQRKSPDAPRDPSTSQSSARDDTLFLFYSESEFFGLTAKRRSSKEEQ